MFIHPLDKESASPELSDLFSALTKKFGKIPGIFGTMAHRPGALKGMVEINSAVMEHGTIEPRYRELAYLKTSLNNGCEY